MRAKVFVTLVLVATCATANAQPFGGRGGRGGPGGPGGGRFSPEQMMNRLVEELQLDENQLAQLAPVFDEARANMSAMRDRWQQIRTAEEAGDSELAGQLREQMRSDFERGPERMETFFSNIQPVLRDDQVTRLNDMRQRMQQRQLGFERMRRITQTLPDELNLSDEQRDDYQQMIATYRDRIREGWQSMRPLFEEMRAAEETGDTARLAELRAEMEQSRPDMDAYYQNFMTELAGKLDEQQLLALADVRSELDGPGPAAAAAPGEAPPSAELPDVRTLLKLVRRIDLSADQRDALRDIERDALDALRDARREGDAAEAALAKEVHTAILAELDETQKDELGKLINTRTRSRRN